MSNSLLPATRPVPPETKIAYVPGDKTPRVSSRALAEAFGKEHKHVLAQIKEVRQLCPYEFGRLNFRPSEYVNSQGKLQPEFLLSRDGFSLVAMGFTGARALRFKLAYIEAFNALEARHLPMATARQMLNMPQAQRLRLKKALAYKERGFTQKETALVMGLAQRTIGRLMAQARALGLEA